MQLSDKIISLEEYLTAQVADGSYIRGLQLSSRSALSLHTGISYPKMYGNTFALQGVDRLANDQWWIHRELMRQHYGVYAAPTAALASLQQSEVFKQYLPHISRDDPTLIAFTATPEDGIRDKQTRVAMGRFIRKFSPWMPDKDVAAIESAHRSELNPDIRLHNFLDEWDTCYTVYTNASPACMSKGDSSYQIKGSPLRAYQAPGWFVAAMYRPDGSIVARATVWINPENEADKRQVRVYGDNALQLWLDRKGFAHRGFEGAYLNTKVIGAHSSTSDATKAIMCPYVDSGTNPSTGKTQRTAEENNAYGIWDGNDRLYLINAGHGDKYKGYLAGVQSTSGFIQARPFPINGVCVVTGQKFNAMTSAFVEVWHKGAKGFAIKSAVSDFRTTFIDRNTSLLAAKTEKTFVHGSNHWLDTDANREATGHQRLSAKFYPDRQEWVRGLINITVTTAGDTIVTDDLVQIITGNRLRSIHQAELPKDADRVASINEIKTFAAADAKVVRTAANRKVVPGIHPVVELYDGSWAYERHATAVTMFGTKVFIPKDSDASVLNTAELPTAVKSRVDAVVAKARRPGDMIKRVVYENLMDRGDCFAPISNSGDVFIWDYTFEPDGLSVPTIREFLAQPVDMTKNRNAKEAAVASFLASATKLLAYADAKWAEKAAATTETAATPVAA